VYYVTVNADEVLFVPALNPAPLVELGRQIGIRRQFRGGT